MISILKTFAISFWVPLPSRVLKALKMSFGGSWFTMFTTKSTLWLPVGDLFSFPDGPFCIPAGSFVCQAAPNCKVLATLLSSSTTCFRAKLQVSLELQRVTGTRVMLEITKMRQRKLVRTLPYTETLY